MDKINTLIAKAGDKLTEETVLFFRLKKHSCSTDITQHLKRAEAFLRIITLIPPTDQTNIQGMIDTLETLVVDLREIDIWKRFSTPTTPARTATDSASEDDQISDERDSWSSSGDEEEEDDDDLEHDLEEEIERLELTSCGGCASLLKFYTCAPGILWDCLVHPFDKVYEAHYEDQTVKAICEKAFELLEPDRAVIRLIRRNSRLLVELPSH